MNEGKTI